MATTDGATSRGWLLELEGPLFDGRFRVEERVAEGGFAVVYRAWQVALERRVALKVLKPPRNQDAAGRAEFRERFASEAKTIARLRHAAIVDVYDSSVATLPSGELAPWMALEWIDGETLAGQLGRRRGSGERGRAPRDAFELVRPVLKALAHAHELGIVHRDIKPSNIMVAATPQGDLLRVLDFGIAKIMVDTQAPNTGNTRTESAPAFSPAYAAPEQVAFSRTGPWTDVHALGLVLSEVMTDQAPFTDLDPEAHLFEQVMSARRPTPATKGVDVGLFEPVLAKALALAPRDRWRNAGELVAALEEAAAGRPAVAGGAASTASPTPRGRAARRVVVAALAVAALAGGAVALRSATRTAASPASPAPRVETAIVPRPEPTPAPSVPPVAVVTPVTPAPIPAAKSVARDRKRVRATPAAVSAGDGRDLFNGTK